MRARDEEAFLKIKASLLGTLPSRGRYAASGLLATIAGDFE
jgi:hypothetical protein